MEEWKEYKLGEVLCDKGYIRGPFGSALRRGDLLSEGVPVYEQQHAIYNKREFRFYISEDKYNEMRRFTVYPNDIIISCSGTVGEVSLIKKDDPKGIISQALLLLRPNNNVILSDYLLYFFKTNKGHNSITSRSYGSVQVNIARRNIIEDIPLFLPNIRTQAKIVSILKSLDDKIEVNKRINEYLEQLAQALFKSWFVDFEPFKNGEFVESELGMIPKGWRVMSIGEMPLLVTDYVANGSFASLKENVKLYDSTNFAYFIRNTDLKSKKFCVYVDEHSYNFLSKSKLEGGEIIISNVGDVGSVHLCPYLDKPMTLGNNIIMVKPDYDYLRNFLYVLFRWNYGQKLIQSIKGGSAQPKFNKTDFKSLRIVVPSDTILQMFDKIVSPIFKQISRNDEEGNCLAQLRDTLLPRLMSGELKVNEIENSL